MSSAIAVRGEAAEVASAEARAVLSMVQDEERRGKLADLVAAIEDGEVEGDDAQALEEVLELGLQTGRVRALYGPGGEQAALGLFRRLPLGKEIAETTRELNEALSALEGRRIEKISVTPVGPGEYGVTVSTEDFEIALRLGKAGARVTSIGT